MRSFHDESGRLWMAFAVTPETMFGVRADVLPGNFVDGWLVFECAEERRRLAPFPDDWNEYSDAALCTLVAGADRVRRRSPHTDMLNNSLFDPPT